MPIRRRLGEASSGKRTAAFTLVAALAAAPLVAIGGGAAINLIDNEDSGPVDAIVDAVSVSDGVDVMVDDARIATKALADERNPTRGLVKEMRRDEEFSMFGLTWEGEDNEALAYFRAEQPDGSWGPWYDADPEDMAGNADNNIVGTEPIYVEPTKAIQFTTVGLGIFEDARGRAADAVNAVIEQTATEIEDSIDGVVPGAGGSVGDVSDGLQGSVSESAGGTVPEDQVGTEDDDELKGAAYDHPSQIPADDEDETEAPREEAPTEDEAPADDAPADTDGGTGSGSLDPGSSDSGSVDLGETGSLGIIDASNIEAVFIDGNVGDDETIAPISDNKDLSQMPSVVSRSGWGANEGIRCGSPRDMGEIKAVTVHHTAGSNNYSQAQANGIMRGIYTYHAQNLGWCDVGYNALVDKYGTIYEGRAGGLDKAIQGAHAGGFNTDTWGISMMGDYNSVAPPQVTLDSMSDMIGWRMSLDDVEPLSETTLTSSGFSGALYSAGTSVDLPAIFAHRDVGNTNCPGDVGYSRMDDIRDGAKDAYDRYQGGGGLTGGLGNRPSGNDNGTGNGNGNTGGGSGGTSDDSDDSTGDDDDDDGDSNGTNGNGGSGSGSDSSSGSSGSSGSLSIFADVLEAMGAPNMGSTLSGILSALDNPDRPFTIEDIPVLVEAVITANEEGDFADEWNTVLANFGSVLGDAETGVQEGADTAETGNTSDRSNSNRSDSNRSTSRSTDEDKGTQATDRLQYVKFEHGIITSSEATGTNAIWGPIADAWAAQGYEVGELGAPTETARQDGHLWIAEFQGGTITFDENTGEATVDLND